VAGSSRAVNMEDRESIPSFADYLATDRGKPARCLFEQSTVDLGNGTVSKDRYLAQEWHDLEVEKLWKRVWQMACRTNDIPDPGDQIEYQIADQSILIVRVAPDVIKAYHNTCRHRGTPLVTGCSTAQEIQCGFHGWTWNLDGSLKNVPCRWDFPEVTESAYALPEVRSAIWDGSVFINLDPNAEPLEDFLGEAIPDHFEQMNPRRTWKAMHVGKVVPANWKIGQEAFLELYHVFKTHPETNTWSDDIGAQYDFYGPHARILFANGAPSPVMGGSVEPQTVMQGMLGAFNGYLDQDAKLKPGQSPREALSDLIRGMLNQMTGIDFSSPEVLSDSEVIDGFEYFVYPNLFKWAGNAYPAGYRWRPNGNDPESSIYEIMAFVTFDDGTPLPRDTQLTMIPTERPFADVPGMAGIGALLDQDVEQVSKMHRGIRSSSFTDITLSNYQERNIRNFHQHLETWLQKP
jgi:nitrite reductase/ring-hydroxylating ferredoxin subunit